MRHLHIGRHRLTRREMCLRLGGIAACAAFGVPLPAHPSSPAEETRPRGKKPRFRFRHVLASCLYGRTKIAEILPEVRRAGAAQIDIWPEHHANQREQLEALGHDEFLALLEKHRVRLGMITRFDLGPFGLADEMRVVAKLGGDLLVTGSRGPEGLEGRELKAAVRTFVEKIKPSLELAGELGVTVGIENHGHSLICSPDSIRYLAEISPTDRLGIAFAPYHLPQDPRLLAALIRDVGPRLVHFYAWQYGKGCMKKLPKDQELEQLPGRGSLDFKPLVAALAGIDYKGSTEIFMHPVPRGVPILESTEKVTAAVCRAREYLEGCLRDAGHDPRSERGEEESRSRPEAKPALDA